MSIVKMSKFNLLVFNYDRENLLKELQKFQYIHFNDLTKTEDEEINTLERVLIDTESNAVLEELTKVNWAINLLLNYKEKESLITTLKEGVPTYTFDEIMDKGQKIEFSGLYNELLNSNNEINISKQNIHNANLKISELKVWESITQPIDVLYGLEKVYFATGMVPSKNLDKLKEDLKDINEVYFEIVNEVKGDSYLYFISTLEFKVKALEIFRNNGFNYIHIDSKGKIVDYVSLLNSEIDKNQTIIDNEEAKIKNQLGSLEDLKIYYDFLANTKLRESSVENFVKTERVNVIEGFVPTNKEDGFKKKLEETLGDRYYLDINPADREDPQVPIILQNNSFVKAFENMTVMYSLPKYNEVDPTPLFAPFYALFAGMMVGDFGYGLLLTIACIIGIKFFNLKEGMRQFLRFFMFIGMSTTFWGFIYGSVFGFELMKNPVMSPAVDYQAMMILSLTLGGIHIFFGLAIQAYMKIRDGNKKDALFDVGFWYMAVLGLIAFGLANIIPNINQTIGKVFLIIAIAGMVGVLLTGGRAEKSIGGKIGEGVYQLYGITGYIGDFVSYLRLLALALAGGFIALAVNMIVGLLFGSGIIGAIFGLFIFIVFQLFNMFLAYLGAYVHTARLTYVEMFNKFYEGGGKAFKGLIEQSKYFNIKNENK